MRFPFRKLAKFKVRLRYTYGLKKNIVLAHRQGIDIQNTDFDMMIAYYLLDNTTKDDLSLKMSDYGVAAYYYEDLVNSLPKWQSSRQEFLASR